MSLPAGVLDELKLSILKFQLIQPAATSENTTRYCK